MLKDVHIPNQHAWTKYEQTAASGQAGWLRWSNTVWIYTATRCNPFDFTMNYSSPDFFLEQFISVFLINSPLWIIFNSWLHFVSSI